MTTSSMDTFSALLTSSVGYSPATGDAELWSVPQQTTGQTVETPVIWDTIALIVTSLLCDSTLSIIPSLFS